MNSHTHQPAHRSPVQIVVKKNKVRLIQRIFLPIRYLFLILFLTHSSCVSYCVKINAIIYVVTHMHTQNQ